jgi:predicted AlkP superfamily pyrophosphatase or phosphodiesterase
MPSKQRSSRLPTNRWRHSAVLLATTLAVTLLLVPAGARAARAGAPKLVVVVVVDQMRADFLVRFAGLFTGGFRRLTRDGAVFADAHQDHAATLTAVGHATISTGSFPSHHGIVGNDWYDRESGSRVASTTDPNQRILGRPGATGQSPSRLLRSALGDWLKAASPRSKVFSVAYKPRSAILMGGQRPDGAFWYDDDIGAFVTSAYYTNTVPAWVDTFNASGVLYAHFAEGWRKLLREEAYFVSSEDRVEAENDGKNVTFPYVFDDGSPGARDRYRSTIADTPFGDEHTLEFAKAIVANERLGEDAEPDILWVSCSATDHVGHSFGPMSHEVQDSYLRLDRSLGAFFEFLDAKVGSDGYVVALSSDHGVLPLPEELRRRGFDAGRISSIDLLSRLRAAVREVTEPIGAGPDVIAYAGSDGIVLKLPPAGKMSVTAAEVRRRIAERLRTIPYIVDVYTHEDLVSGVGGREYIDVYRRSYYPGRSADILLRFKPNYLVSNRNHGTTHGAPYPYDTHVPMVFAGPGIRAATHANRVRTADVAPTLAEWLGVPLPSDLDGVSLREATPPR